MSRLPRIGITVDNRDSTAASGQYESAIRYSRGIARAGGLPLLLPHEPELAPHYVELCDAIVLTGGDDPATEAFGQPTDPRSRLIDPRRQAFELALLDAAAHRPHKPVLGICLGMQIMALHAGGRLNPHLPDTLPTAQDHQGNRTHSVIFQIRDGSLPPADDEVVSSHHQAVSDPGRLRVLAVSPDGVIEAVDAPPDLGRTFYLGVQWHPERGGDGPLSAGLLARLVHAAREAS